MQATVHTHVQLAATTPHNELAVPAVAHFALEVTIFNLGELLSTLVLALISITKLLLHLDDTAPSFRWKNIRGRSSVDHLLSTPY
jgi:hypothetical protein